MDFIAFCIGVSFFLITPTLDALQARWTHHLMFELFTLVLLNVLLFSVLIFGWSLLTDLILGYLFAAAMLTGLFLFAATY